MNKRERISQWLTEATGEDVKPHQADVEKHPYYRAFFRCWNEQHYYEAHDVLEQLWLNSESPEADFFKGLIQAAGAFVSVGAEKSGEFRAIAPWAGCCGDLPPFEPVRR